MNPAMQVVEIRHSHIICTSDWDVIGPGNPNKPAGARHRSFDVWDDEEDI